MTIVNPDDIEPGYVIGIARIASEFLLSGDADDPKEAAVMACDIIDATCDELCIRATAYARQQEIARGSRARGGDS